MVRHWYLSTLILICSTGLAQQPVKNITIANQINVAGNYINGEISQQSISAQKKNYELEKKVKNLFARDSTKYKVLIFPFNQQTHYGDCTKDYATEACEQLSALNRQDNLDLSIGWLTEEYKMPLDYASDSIEEFGKRVKADFILYGSYDKNCSSDSGEVCVKYIAFKSKKENISTIKTKISDVDFSRGNLITDVKALLYYVVAIKYYIKDFRKYFYYLDKALLSSGNYKKLGINQFPMGYLATYRDSDYYSYPLFRRDIVEREKHLEIDTGEELTRDRNEIGMNYLQYGIYDSAYYYLWHPNTLLTYRLYVLLKLGLFAECAQNTDEVLHWIPYDHLPPDYVFSPHPAYEETALTLYYLKALTALKFHDYAKADGYMDAIIILQGHLPDSYFVTGDLNEFFPPYLRKIQEALVKVKLGNYKEARFYLLSADSMKTSIPSSRSNMPNFDIASHYVSDNHLIYGGEYFRLCYILQYLDGGLQKAYKECNYYIDSVPYLVQHAVNKKADIWPYFQPKDIVNICDEDFYNRALISYKLGFFEKSAQDIERCLSINKDFIPAKKLLAKLNEQGYGISSAKDASPSLDKNEELQLSFDTWNW